MILIVGTLVRGAFLCFLRNSVSPVATATCFQTASRVTKDCFRIFKVLHGFAEPAILECALSEIPTSCRKRLFFSCRLLYYTILYYCFCRIVFSCSVLGFLWALFKRSSATPLWERLRSVRRRIRSARYTVVRQNSRDVFVLADLGRVFFFSFFLCFFIVTQKRLRRTGSHTNMFFYCACFFARKESNTTLNNKLNCILRCTCRIL